ncbi:uncharacterized protein [Henckelia pumila]|uniref:uncharacterized protein n=1 Tax=Henckelia pumila TaxID=405737 RepID=UPI003C6E9425
MSYSMDWRKMCDRYQKRKPVKPDGAMITIVDAGRLRGFRPQAKRALKVYKKSNSTRFKLEKMYKVNYIGARYQYITFGALEVESLGRTLFRGVVHGDDKFMNLPPQA